MSSLITPPPPKVLFKTESKSNKYYTIHSNPRNAFGVRSSEDSPTLMVGFRHKEDAHLMACMLETYYLINEHLPPPNLVSEFDLPSEEESVTDLRHLFLLHNDTDNLVAWCRMNFIDFLAIDEVLTGPNGRYSWDATTYKPEVDFEFCRERFDYLYDL